MENNLEIYIYMFVTEKKKEIEAINKFKSWREGEWIHSGESILKKKFKELRDELSLKITEGHEDNSSPKTNKLDAIDVASFLSHRAFAFCILHQTATLDPCSLSRLLQLWTSLLYNLTSEWRSTYILRGGIMPLITLLPKSQVH